MSVSAVDTMMQQLSPFAAVKRLICTHSVRSTEVTRLHTRLRARVYECACVCVYVSADALSYVNVFTAVPAYACVHSPLQS